MKVVTEEELLSAVRSKRVPNLQKRASAADLSLQEFEIMKTAHGCNSLDAVNELIDKFVVYIALAKCLNSEGK